MLKNVYQYRSHSKMLHLHSQNTILEDQRCLKTIKSLEKKKTFHKVTSLILMKTAKRASLKIFSLQRGT